MGAGSSLRRIPAGSAWERQGLDSSRPSARRRQTVGVEQAEEKAWGGPRGGRRQREWHSQQLRGRTTSGIPPGPHEARGGGWGDGGLGPLVTGRLGTRTA